MRAPLAALVAGACSGGDRSIDGRLHATLEDATVRLSLPLNLAGADAELVPDLTIEGLSFPTDVTPLPEGGFAVLDRLDATLVLHDSLGNETGRLGRAGHGPGEYVEPYAVAASGAYLAIWDKSGRLTTVRSDGSVAGTTDAVRGDLPAAWQRVPLTNWDEPLQLSREDVTRRLSALADGSFDVLIQDRDERSDSAFMRHGDPTRFDHQLVAVDSLARPGETLLVLPGQELRLERPSGGGAFYMAWERPYPLRPLWAAGDGWHAWGHGGDTAITVAFDSGDSLVVAWPRDSRPLADADYHHYIDWEIEGYRRTRGERSAERVASFSREGWIEEELAVAEERPQIVGLLADGPCLALAGFRPDQGSHGEASIWVLLDLRDPADAVVVDLGPSPAFTRALAHGRFYTIEIGDNGLRRVQRIPLGTGSCAQAGQGRLGEDVLSEHGDETTPS
jgi:hypothetical protein